ncbi:glucose-6-phosphate isomerase [Natranaerobius thermophilus]|uniref:Glucose-6-phosphate isomerase n=1 Tax=Natranaerobius thermophilus (strain ATCC BAA-1301 / DSM 18059 / JW/NM-WN-LF) TaxID=457570 RepID=B2A6X9_NATTJ|nr:glucose-6-phosphate isomerase [Natranaerobius thermophilus]ACB85570.1 glucose-6-phosphate isomerase [Natranaerobius thermophilus JW/NM-WN-LF]
MKEYQLAVERIEVNWNYCSDFIKNHELDAYQAKIHQIHEQIHEKTGLGNDALDWLELPLNYEQSIPVTKIKELAENIRSKADVFLVIGVGGSYIGARAAIEFLRPDNNSPEILYLGHHLSPRYINEVLASLEGRQVFVNVISKSGGTLEPSLAFRTIRSFMEERFGKDEARRRIIATTDGEKGKLKALADKEGYETLVIPDGIGGRYSVLTPVGLLPIAVSGVNIKDMLNGAQKAYEITSIPDLDKNPAYIYAALRHILLQKGKQTEILVTYDPFAGYLGEWWKQLFGESEGKDGKGIFPTRADFTTDLHSLGQYIQEGSRHLFATTVWWETEDDLVLPGLNYSRGEEGDNKSNHENDDGLTYLQGKSFHEINRQAFLGTVQAHNWGGVPNIVISLPEINSYYLGLLFYFFMKSCAASGYLLGVNPFNQPGVEAYKQNVLSRLEQI